MHAYECFDKSGSPSLYDKGYQVGKDADHGTGYQHKDQYTCNPFFKVGVLAEKVSGVKEETDKEDDTENNRKDDPNGVRDVIYGIFDTPNLGVGWCG